MKTIIKSMLLTVLLSLILVMPVLADNYKSFAELHPFISQERDMPELGIIKIQSGIQYTALAEAKVLDRDSWYQIIDAETRRKGQEEIVNITGRRNSQRTVGCT